LYEVIEQNTQAYENIYDSTLSDNTDALAKTQKLIYDEIYNGHNIKLQLLINDVTVLVFKRIIQLTKVSLPVGHIFARSLSWYKTSLDQAPPIGEISKRFITIKLQELLDELASCIKTEQVVFHPAQSRDIVRLEEMIISSVSKGSIPHVSTDEILSRFLWIVYARLRKLPTEEIICNELLDSKGFLRIAKPYLSKDYLNYRWKGDVMDAALLAKSNAEKARDLPLSLDMNGYTISARTIKAIEEHPIITISEIKRTLQRSMDLIHFLDKGNGENVFTIRSSDVRWFCSLFETDKGKVLIKTPKDNTPVKIIYECVKTKALLDGNYAKPSLDEKLLENKSIICYDDTVRISGEKNHPIFVSKGTISCQKHGHALANVTAIVRTLRGNKHVSIPVQKCLTCNPHRYFVSDTILEKYESEYGPLYFRRLDDLDYYFWNPSAWQCQNAESLLYKLGYNVNENNGLSASQRQQILYSIIAKGQMMKSEIMHHINLLIRQHQEDPKYYRAVEKWRCDLHYLSLLKDTNDIFSGYLYR